MKTIGHSTRSIEEFLAILDAFEVRRIVDIRKMPRSRFNPQFNLEALKETLESRGVTYSHMPSLAGLRSRSRDSVNRAWRNKSFQAFADYMQTKEFEDATDELTQLPNGENSALMCAEAVPWRCHRSLIADALVARGFTVQHLMSNQKAITHCIREFAEVTGKKVSYPSPD